MLLNFDEIQTQVHEYGKFLNIPLRNLKIFNAEQTDGTPFILIIGDEYYYISMERGQVISEKTTKNTDELLYWIMKDISWQEASYFELNNRKRNQDFRCLLFAIQLDLLGQINTAWKVKRQSEIDEILAVAPYNNDDL